MADLFDTLESQPFCVRTNNWLKLRSSGKQFKMLSGVYDGYCMFYAPEYSIRAAHQRMKDKLLKNNFYTVEEFVYFLCGKKNLDALEFVGISVNPLKLCRDLSFDEKTKLFIRLVLYFNGSVLLDHYTPSLFQKLIELGLCIN